jgi:hypothetical protein
MTLELVGWTSLVVAAPLVLDLSVRLGRRCWRAFSRTPSRSSTVVPERRWANFALHVVMAGMSPGKPASAS